MCGSVPDDEPLFYLVAKRRHILAQDLYVGTFCDLHAATLRLFENAFDATDVSRKSGALRYDAFKFPLGRARRLDALHAFAVARHALLERRQFSRGGIAHLRGRPAGGCGLLFLARKVCFFDRKIGLAGARKLLLERLGALELLYLLLEEVQVRRDFSA